MKSHATESKSMLGEVTRELTEEEFDEAAGKKDACYRKVKSLTKYGLVHMQVAPQYNVSKLERPTGGIRVKNNGIKYHHTIEMVQVAQLWMGLSLRYAKVCRSERKEYRL